MIHFLEVGMQIEEARVNLEHMEKIQVPNDLIAHTKSDSKWTYAC